jgi:hypothetical protein
MPAAVSIDLSEIEPVRQRIQAWRGSQSRSKAMPDALWQEAGAVARKLGMARVAKELGLNYTALKARTLPPQRTKAGAQMGERSSPPVARAQFIELGTVAELSPRGGTGEPMLLELMAPDGTRLTIRTREAGASVLAMIAAFRGRS